MNERFNPAVCRHCTASQCPTTAPLSRQCLTALEAAISSAHEELLRSLEAIQGVSTASL